MFALVCGQRVGESPLMAGMGADELGAGAPAGVVVDGVPVAVAGEEAGEGGVVNG